MKLPGDAEAGFMTGETGILRLDRLLAGVAPPGVAGPLEHQPRGDQRPRRSPRHLFGAVIDVLTYAGEEVVGQLTARREPIGDQLWARRQDDGFWVQRLYGQEFRGLTPPHGLVGNVQALRPLLDRSRRRRLELDTATVLAPS
jgi:hypothetical protein